MNTLVCRLLTATIAVLIAAPVLAAPAAVGAWVRLNPVADRPSAGYVTLVGDKTGDALVGVTAPGLRIELHSMSMAGGIMKMARLDTLPVPAGGQVALAPGGNHLMIFGLTGAPKTLALTLVFASGAHVPATAEVRAAGDAPPAMNGMTHGDSMTHGAH